MYNLEENMPCVPKIIGQKHLVSQGMRNCHHHFVRYVISMTCVVLNLHATTGWVYKLVNVRAFVAVHCQHIGNKFLCHLKQQRLY